ncbi:hypothetical protein SAMN05444920_1116 [Nonomuraea solani]|uniref:Uncharacterized protein n=1 Tax=Nonomuraea solani TaxID=1144553 RepID=A0A1H6ELH4_9ACTN|nr:hypothetical protein [Nonomuraea solani]SEG97669.1 hypothetical protein SAMN05444920_1116 [Nonomuraea solani]
MAKCGSNGTKWLFNDVTTANFRLQTYDGFQCLETTFDAVAMHDCIDWPSPPGMKWLIVGHGSQTWAPISNYATSEYLNIDRAGGNVGRIDSWTIRLG